MRPAGVRGRWRSAKYLYMTHYYLGHVFCFKASFFGCGFLFIILVPIVLRVCPILSSQQRFQQPVFYRNDSSRSIFSGRTDYPSRFLSRRTGLGVLVSYMKEWFLELGSSGTTGSCIEQVSYKKGWSWSIGFLQDGLVSGVGFQQEGLVNGHGVYCKFPTRRTDSWSTFLTERPGS